MNTCTRGTTSDMSNTKLLVHKTAGTHYWDCEVWPSKVNTRNAIESVGDFVVIQLYQLSMGSTGYKMRGWMKIGFVLG